MTDSLRRTLAALPEPTHDHDADGSFPFETFAALKGSGYLWAPVPAEFGGGGVDSVHDLVVASELLSRSHPSIALGVNMHWMVLRAIETRRHQAHAAGDTRGADSAGKALAAIVAHGIVTATAASERDQDLSHPLTRATRVDDGWSVTGHKICCTLVPAADVLSVAVSVDTDDGQQYAFAQVPVSAPGVTVHDDWDALGMRASGSHSVSFDDVRISKGSVSSGISVEGGAPQLLDRYLASGAMHAATTLGVAVSAHEQAITYVNRRHAETEPSPRAIGLVAENVVAIGAMRATLAAAADVIDDASRAGAQHVAADEMTDRYAAVQAAKAFVDRSAVAVVDRAMELCGGAAYGRRHPMARAYRDVRAGGFMHPLGANRAWDYVALAALGRRPSLR